MRGEGLRAGLWQHGGIQRSYMAYLGGKDRVDVDNHENA